MNDNFALSISHGARRLLNPDKRGYLVGILAVFVPLITIGLIGDSLGTDTELVSGLVITFAYLLALVIATAVLKAQGSGWQELGLARPKSWRKTIAMALGTLVVLLAAMIIVQIILMNIPGLSLPPSDQGDYNPLAGNLLMFLVMTVAAWTTVTFGEEMLFRAFLIVSLAGALGDLKARWALALVGSSLLFGLAHYDWGPAGIIDTAVMGLVTGFIYLRTGRNLWVTIIAHGLANTLKFGLIYAGVM